MDKKKKILIGAGVGILVIAGVIVLLLKPKKTYEVVFDTAGGNTIETQKVKEGDKVKKPANPTKENYEFIMWEYNGSEYDFTKPVKENLTLKASWKENVKKYKITFTLDGKQQELELSELTEATLSQLTFEDKVGYEIKWYVDDKEYDFTTPLTSSYTKSFFISICSLIKESIS